MIEIVKLFPFCDTCPEFIAKQDSIFFDHGEDTMHRITCENDKLCCRIAKHIRKEYDRRYIDYEKKGEEKI